MNRDLPMNKFRIPLAYSVNIKEYQMFDFFLKTLRYNYDEITWFTSEHLE